PEARAFSTAALLLAGTLLAFASASADETPQQKLGVVERELERGRTQQEQLTRQADALAQELQALRTEGVRAAERVQAREATLATLEAQMQSLATEEAQRQGGGGRGPGPAAGGAPAPAPPPPPPPPAPGPSPPAA